jgi:hypothetical protein
MENKTKSAFTPAEKVTKPYKYPSYHPMYTLDVHSDSYVAIDGLGRRLPTYEEVGEKSSALSACSISPGTPITTTWSPLITPRQSTAALMPSLITTTRCGMSRASTGPISGRADFRLLRQ